MLRSSLVVRRVGGPPVVEHRIDLGLRHGQQRQGELAGRTGAGAESCEQGDARDHAGQTPCRIHHGQRQRRLDGGDEEVHEHFVLAHALRNRLDDRFERRDALADELDRIPIGDDAEQLAIAAGHIGGRHERVAHLAKGRAGTGGLGHDRTRALHDVRGGEHAGAVDVLHELLDVVVRRVGEDVFRRADLHDAAVAHHGDAIAEEHGLVEVVGDEDDGLLQLLLQFEQLLLHLATDKRVERAERLIHEQDVGVGRERPGDAHALLHPAGQFGGELLGLALETHQGEDLFGLLQPLVLPHTLELERVGDVGGDRAVRQQCEVLEDHRDAVSADLAQPTGGDAGDGVAVHDDGPIARLVQAVEHADDGRLAGAGQPHDHEDLAPVHGETGIDDGCGPCVADGGSGLTGLESTDGAARILPEHLVQIARF